MFTFLRRFRENLIVKIIFATGSIMLVCTLILVYLSITFVNEYSLSERVNTADVMANIIRKDLNDAMLRNSPQEINQIIQQAATLHPVESIRIYNKHGEVVFSTDPNEVGTKIMSRDFRACKPCHSTNPVRQNLGLMDRVHDFYSDDDRHLFSVVSAIPNSATCAAAPCHAHPADKTMIGAMDLVFAYDDTDAQIANYQVQLIVLGTFFFIITSGCIFFGMRQIITKPLSLLIKNSEDIAQGRIKGIDSPITARDDELGKLAKSQVDMVKALRMKQEALNAKMREYELLFDNVPCIVTVQDRDFKLLEYNKESRERFNPFPGAYCYQAYKGIDEKCEICPVERTFETGVAHCSEESRQNPDGTYSHWIVHTAPIVDENGNVTKAMEMCLDITQRKKLEEQLKESEKKYHTIFNNVPNSIFVLDKATLNILDCNSTANDVYQYDAGELIDTSFIDLIHPDEVARIDSQMKAFTSINQVKNIRKNGESFFVDIMLASSGHSDMDYLLVSTTDITERLEAEQLLIHAGKMATLGEMATGVAHELNQPLTVIKTSSNFLVKKVAAGECVPTGILETLAREMDSYVDRATKIINHMREFGRREDQVMESVDVNLAVDRAFTLLNKQFSARGIRMVWELSKELPPVFASYDQLEQVFINLFVNARDVLEEKTDGPDSDTPEISVRTFQADGSIVIQIGDNGGGIPEDIIHKIFEPFYTTKKVGKGTGLGLSISYGLINDFGGSIHAENSDGGALFTIKLPVAES